MHCIWNWKHNRKHDQALFVYFADHLFFLDFAQPIHFAKQERVYGIFYAYVFTKKVLPVVCRRLMSYIFTPGLWWAPFRVPRPVSCVSNAASFSWLSIRLKSSVWQIKKGDPIYTVMRISPRLVLTGKIVIWGGGCLVARHGTEKDAFVHFIDAVWCKG
jgi:hypothetical protein